MTTLTHEQAGRVRTWINELRSGNYPQTTGRLHDQNGYCCLGVACEVAVKAGIISARSTSWGPLSYGTDGHRSTTDLPDAAVEWFGFEDAGGPSWQDAEDRFRSGITMNDDEGKNFNEIADAIEAWLDDQRVKG